MIRLRKSGTYRLIETRRHTKVLYLDNDSYAWVEPWVSKEILIMSRRAHITDCTLSIGEYCLYDVRGEPHLPGRQFLELEVGDDIWQGYLLLSGLPTAQKKRGRIIATHELVTNNPAYSDNGQTHISKSNADKKGELYEVTRTI